MKPDDFETQLRGQPPRKIPAVWREEILDATTVVQHGMNTECQRGDWRSLISGIFARPHQLAWGGIAAIWIVIGILNLTSHASSRLVLAAELPAAGTLQALRQEKRLLLAELGGITPTMEALPRKAARPGPRSEGRAVAATT